MTGSCLLVITTNQSIKMNKSSFQAPEDILNLCEEDSKNGQSKTLTCQNALQNEAFLIQRFGSTIFNKTNAFIDQRIRIPRRFFALLGGHQKVRSANRGAVLQGRSGCCE